MAEFVNNSNGFEDYNGGVGAYVVPDEKVTPLDYHLQNLANVDAWRKDQEKKAQEKRAQAAKMAADVQIDPNKSWSYDIPTITALGSGLVDFNAHALNAGFDPNDPKNITQYLTNKKLQQSVLSAVEMSKEQQKTYETALADYQKEPNKYSKKTLELLQAYPHMSMTERMQHGNLLVPKPTDWLEKLNTEESKGKSDEIPKTTTDGGYITTTNTEIFTPEKGMSVVRMNLTNPDNKEAAMEDFTRENPDVQAKFTQQAADWNASHPKDEPITSLEAYAHSMMQQNFYVKKKEEKKVNEYGVMSYAHGLKDEDDVDGWKPTIEGWSEMAETAKKTQGTQYVNNPMFNGYQLQPMVLTPNQANILVQQYPDLAKSIKLEGNNAYISNSITAMKMENGRLYMKTNVGQAVDDILKKQSYSDEDIKKILNVKQLPPVWEDVTDNGFGVIHNHILATDKSNPERTSNMFQKSASQYYDKTTGRKGYENGAVLNTDVIYKPKAEVKKETKTEAPKSSANYTNVTKAKDKSGNVVTLGIKNGKWYNTETNEEIK